MEGTSAVQIDQHQCFLSSLLQVNRPKSLCKDTIQTRNRKSSSNKSKKTKQQKGKPSITSPSSSPIHSIPHASAVACASIPVISYLPGVAGQPPYLPSSSPYDLPPVASIACTSTIPLSSADSSSVFSNSMADMPPYSAASSAQHMNCGFISSNGYCYDHTDMKPPGMEMSSDSHGSAYYSPGSSQVAPVMEGIGGTSSSYPPHHYNSCYGYSTSPQVSPLASHSSPMSHSPVMHHHSPSMSSPAAIASPVM